MSEPTLIGKSVPRTDALEKVTGRAKYGVDVDLPGMLHAKVLRSRFPHARILSIDTSRAEKLPGVRAVITAEDTLKEKAASGWQDKYPLALDKVRYVGEEIAAVAATDELIAEEALGLIKVNYEELPAVFDPEEAVKPGAPRIHDVENNIAHKVETEFGDIVKGFAEADYIFEDRFTIPPVHTSPLEPNMCIASFDPTGKLTFWENSHDPWVYRRFVPRILGIAESKVKIVQNYIGGNFGSLGCDFAPFIITALLAKKTGRPVRLVNTREEELMASRPRMPEIVYLKAGVKKDGTLTARHFRIMAMGGAYAGLAPQMMVEGLADCIGLYKCPNLKVETKCVYTNTLPSGPCRSFGISQPQFAIESQMDMISEKLGVDPIELRLKNAHRTGDVTVLGQKISSCGLPECLKKVEDNTGWQEKRARKQPYRGIGVACRMDHSDTHVPQSFNGSIALLTVLEDGIIRINSGEYEWGQGALTVLSQIAAEELGVPLNKVEFSEKRDTDTQPYTLGPYGSGPVTVRGGHAVRLAAIDMRKQLLAQASKILGAPPEELEIKSQKVYIKGVPEKGVSMAEVASYARYRGAEITGKGVWEADTTGVNMGKMYGNYSSSYHFIAEIVEVEVDPETGRVKVLGITTSPDAGRVINPMLAEGQCQGGIMHEMGIGLAQEIMYDRGTVVNPDFIDYKIPTAMDVPPIKTFFVESNDPNGPYGAKGCAGHAHPTPAALANAIYNATGVRVKELPLTPMKILQALDAKGR